MVGKKGYIRTLEAALAMILTLSFVIFVIPSPNNISPSETGKTLIGLIDSNDFRNEAITLNGCVNKNGNTTLNSIMNPLIRTGLNYSVCKKGTLPDLPRKNVNAESIFLTGNFTNYSVNIIRLYYFE